MTRGFVVGSYDDIVMITRFVSGLGFRDHDIAQVEGLTRFDGEVSLNLDALFVVAGRREVGDPVKCAWDQ